MHMRSPYIAFMPFCPDLKAVAFQQAGIQRRSSWTDGIRCRLTNCGQQQSGFLANCCFQCWWGVLCLCPSRNPGRGGGILFCGDAWIFVWEATTTAPISVPLPQSLGSRAMCGPCKNVPMDCSLHSELIFLPWPHWCENYSRFTHYL